MRIRPLLITAAALTVAVLSAGEWMHWRSSRRGLGSRAHPGGGEAVVVLGYRNRGRRANYVNRYRVRAGLRSQRGGEASVLVLCGGAVGGDLPEAELMARYARDERGYRGPLQLDRDSRTTWENIRNAIPLIEHAAVIKIVSNSLHAEKGRTYLAQMRPDLAERLVRADDYRFGEIMLLKPIAAVVGWRRRPRADRPATAASTRKPTV